MTATASGARADRRLPDPGEIYLDHIAHFVADPQRASQALARAGFDPTPISVQVNADPAGGPPQPSGTGNVTAMLEHGYLEVLFKTADTALSREFDAAIARYRGVHLAAFAVADAAATHARLAASGFAMQPLTALRRPVSTPAGEDIAAFSVVRLVPGEMPEGRIQALTHLTEHTVWQERWLNHRNGAAGLLDIVIVEPDLAAAIARFSRFFGRGAEANAHGAIFRLDRGCVQLVPGELSQFGLGGIFGKLAIPSLPFMAVYGIKVTSLDCVAACLRDAELAFEHRGTCVVAPFPDDLGCGYWIFVEDAAALPWR
jgi:hypothetical protein